MFPIFNFNGVACLLNISLLLPLLSCATAQTAAEQSPPPSELMSLAQKFNPSMAIVMIAIVSAFFFMGFFSVYLRQCIERRVRGRFNTEIVGIGGHRSWMAARGLNSSDIERFPTFVYSAVKAHKIGKEGLECAVCLNEFEDDETLRLLPSEKFCAPVPIFGPETESDESDTRVEIVETPNQVPIAVDAQSPDVMNHGRDTPNRPPRSRSIRARITGMFPRSHSTGHSLIQPGENRERFTLRLPEEIRNQIMNTSLSRTKSWVALPGVQSSKRGYRANSVGSLRGKTYFNYEQFNGEVRAERLGFSMTPPFVPRTGSSHARSPQGCEGSLTPKTLFRSLKSPFDRLFLPGGSVGERLSDRPRSDSPV
ncbi:RING-H2 finger protein ATL11 [Vitis vinifera]|uniref:RING-type E3 ubiquitin transferase n=1 Tax=Vitis vinifera TaxID=29760 RepID=A0A438C3H5_VITVI|nr:RING-H2 finger protein ATL11 [Vitis vinifera]